MRLWLCLPALVLLPSCAGYGHHHHVHSGGGGAALAVIELFSAVAQIAAASEREPAVVETVYVEAPPPPPAYEPPPPLVRAPVPTHVTMPPPVAPPSAGTPPGDVAKVDPAAARAALSTRNVASCAAHGVPRGYGHATVVFSPSGAPASVTVDAPAGISSDGVACLGDELGRARMPAFSGGAVSVGTTWFIPND